ncbi:MAG TPA: hemerythrin domain-containing protein [Nocardioidaceae bacterium]|nr:hemerythrin domain-containing protein [Nocardioidaceae bacterium]
MAAETLQQALEREHQEIDAGIAAYSAAAASGAAPTDSLTSAMSALRRHIYLEEQFLFPPLRAAGMMAPVFVMIREHGQMWRTLDTLQAQLGQDEMSGFRAESVSGSGEPGAGAVGADPGAAAADGAGAGMLSAIEQLVAELAAHNSKEEQILYPQADAVLNGAASEELRAFLAAGETPAGWVCQGART